jgi:pimeloyl-ACP methyl ester carboxylesterase
MGAGAAVGAAALVGVALGTRPVRTDPLESQLGGGERHFTWRGHRVFYGSRGSGPGLLLVHSVHAAASSFEWRENFRPLSAGFEVFALDLLGFGKSDRPPLRYTARLYVDLIEDFLRDIVGAPAIVAASGLSAAYAVQAAHEAPGQVRGLVLVGPTGSRRVPTAATRALERLMRTGLLGPAAFEALVSRPALRHFLRRQAYGDATSVTREVVDYYYRSAHQPGARYAPAALVGQALNLDVREPFRSLPQPVTVVRGAAVRAPSPAEVDAFRELNPSAALEVLPGAGALAHEERPAPFNEIVRTLASRAGLPAGVATVSASRG